MSPDQVSKKNKFFISAALYKLAMWLKSEVVKWLDLKIVKDLA